VGLGWRLDEDAAVSAADAAIESLIEDVRRTLWLGQLQRASRAALWAWAVIMIAGAILHALVGRPGASTMLAVGAAAWLVALAATALRRPTTGTAALHADRRLGGQSAYATWLETGARESHRLSTPARRRLVEWAAAGVPATRDAMKRRRTDWQLLRPFAAAAICTALAAAVVVLGGTRPTPASGPDASRNARSAATESLQLDEAALAGAIATELAASETPANAPGGRNAGDRQPERRGAATSAGDESEPTTAESAATLRRESGGASAAPGSGREAGDTRDVSAPGASSRAAAGPLLVQRRDLSGSTDAAQRVADYERAAGYEDEPAGAEGVASNSVGSVAAARPPAARHETRLSPAEVAYVVNWQSGSRAAAQEQP
jgi:hypothetical protein